MARPSFFAFTAHSGVTRLPFPCIPSVSSPCSLRVLSVSDSIYNVIILLSLLIHNHKNKVIIRL